ncbi:MAG: FAD-dependent oxidoreductase [Deltaproteobacteria bacterium]|nr:FAD-dependent oxidoreductase [Deltaproteobacteria bacterium]
MSNEDELDVIVVGAGPAGLACAFEVASKGLEVAVLERGDVAGAKNLSGGRLYLGPLRELCGNLLKDAPFERRVVSESIVMCDEDSSLSFRVHTGSGDERAESVTVLRAKLDEFLADKASEAGALVMGQQPGGELVREDGRIAGVMVGEEELRASVVVAADGALSFLAEEVGIRKERVPHSYGVGVKEIIEIKSDIINDRFNVSADQGEARLFIGRITRGLPGGGFIYTNKGSLSIGIVVQMSALQKWKSEEKLWELLERFKERSDVAPLIAGGKTVEYGAHLIPEGGVDDMPPLGIPGLLFCGDAAGLVLNTGATLRGMDLALASGTIAGRSIVAAREADMDPAACLKTYEQALAESFVMKEMQSHRKAPALLALERLYDHYPKETVRVAKKFFEVGKEGESMSIGQAMKKMRRDVLGWRGLKDLWRLYRT